MNRSIGAAGRASARPCETLQHRRHWQEPGPDPLLISGRREQLRF